MGIVKFVLELYCRINCNSFEKPHKFRYLVKGGPDTPQAKREDIYLNILRAVHKSEAELLMSIVGKKLPYKGMTRALMLEVFPDWLPISNKQTPAE